MTFWDSSAVVPLLVTETSTRAMQALASRDDAMLVWWGTRIECASALARLERDGSLDEDSAATAFDRLKPFLSAHARAEAVDLHRFTRVFQIIDTQASVG